MSSGNVGLAEDVGSIPAGYVAYGQKIKLFSLSYTKNSFSVR